MYGLYVDGIVFPQIGYLIFTSLYLFFTSVHSQTTPYLLVHNQG